MARQKMYFKYEIPTSIVEIVKVVCSDYDRREKQIKHGIVTGDVLATYVRLNNIVDCALEDIEVGIRKDILKDIQYRRGYDFSPASPLISKNTYYRRKRKLIYDIAVGLALI